jgi:hypothetical protein
VKKLGAVLIALGVVTGLLVAYWLKVMHALGWDGQTSDYYAAWSSSVPAIFTLVGMSTLITGMWAHVNCHEPGCWRLGKHKVSGTPWCSAHHANARPQRTERELLESIEASLGQLLVFLKTDRHR